MNMNQSDETLEELQSILKDVKQSLQNIRNTSGNSQKSHEDIITNVDKQVQDIIQNVDNAEKKANKALAPRILIPKNLDVKLCRTSDLDRLEEYRSDENKWISLSGIFFGSIMGILVNVVTGGQMTKESWMFVVFFALITVLFGWLTTQAKKRADKIKDKLFSNQNYEDYIDK